MKFIAVFCLSFIFLNVSCKKEEKKQTTDFQLLVDFTSNDKGNPPYHISKEEKKDLIAKIKQTTGKNGAVTIRSSAIGSFTSSNQNEIVHVAFQEDPEASRAEGWGRTYYVVINNGIKLLNAGECNSDKIYKTIRMSNGIDYLFMTAEESPQGEVRVAALLADLSQASLGKAVLVKQFNLVYHNTCGGFYPSQGDRQAASKISYQWVNDTIKFKREHFIKKCGDSAKFVYIETSDKSDEDINLINNGK